MTSTASAVSARRRPFPISTPHLHPSARDHTRRMSRLAHGPVCCVGRRTLTSDKRTGGSVVPYYRRAGEVPRKRHTQFRQPDGSLYAEELMGQEGFSSDSSLLYHQHLPTAIVAAEPYDPP